MSITVIKAAVSEDGFDGQLPKGYEDNIVSGG